MQTIVRYVLFEYLLVFAISLIALTSLLLFVGATLDLPKEVGAEEMVLMLPFLVPEAIRNAMQAAALFAACSVFGRLAGSNELLALSSLGVSPIRVIRPVLLVAVLLSLGCVWLYDLGESWGQRNIEQVVRDQAEAIAYRFLRTNHSYTKGPFTLNVKGVAGRKLVRPTLIMESDEHPEPVTVSAEDGELRTVGRDRWLSIILRNGTVYIGSVARMAFPDSMEQLVPRSDAKPGRRWLPDHYSLADLHSAIVDQQAYIASLARKLRTPAPAWGGQAGQAPAAGSLVELQSERDRLHWLETQVSRRWTNGFFCLSFVMIGIPVAMRVRSRDYLTSFFACFLPVVFVNHPLHNFCIKLAESGRAPAVLPWAGDLALIGVGIWLLSRSLKH